MFNNSQLSKTLFYIITIFLSSYSARHVTKHKSQHKRKMEMSAMAHKMFPKRFNIRRNVECPVCTSQELSTCDWSALDDPTCILPDYQSDCDCCPRCLSKEGEKCGIEETSIGYGKVFECENQLECSTFTGQGVCEKPQDYLDAYQPNMDYMDDEYYNDMYENDEDASKKKETDEIPLGPGCENHATTLLTLSIYYPSALGRQAWIPLCDKINHKLYQPVQCRDRDDSKDQVCWCVNETTGVPTIHMHWAPNAIDDKMCAQLAKEYSSKKKIAN